MLTGFIKNSKWDIFKQTLFELTNMAIHNEVPQDLSYTCFESILQVTKNNERYYLK